MVLTRLVRLAGVPTPRADAMTDAGERVVARVLGAMRSVGDEVQWTQVIAAVAQDDAAFAGAMAQALVDAAPHKSAVAALGPVPTLLTCRAERTLQDAEGVDQGRVDLRFTGDDFALLCELKLHSGYGHRQLDRYMTALAAMPQRRKALIAVTTLQPQRGEDTVAGRPQWLGSMRWADVYDRLHHAAPADLGVATTWRAMLTLLRQTGDFGPMDLKNDLIEAWARRDEAESALRALLNNVTVPALEAIRATVGTGPQDTAAAELHLKGKTQQVFSMKNRMFLHYAVPAAAGEARLRLQVIVFDGEPHFTVEARYEHPRESVDDAPAVAQATAVLKDGFEHGRDGLGWYWARIAKPDEWLAAADTADRMLTIVSETLPVLQASGIFVALAHLRPSTHESSPPQVAG